MAVFLDFLASEKGGKSASKEKDRRTDKSKAGPILYYFQPLHLFYDFWFLGTYHRVESTEF